MTDNPNPETTATPEVEAFAAGIALASGGTILPGFAHGWTSALAPEMPTHELSHRYGTGLDLDCVGVEPQSVYAWACSLDCVDEAILLGTTVHVTLRTGEVDLSGCPKPAKKKKATEEPVE